MNMTNPTMVCSYCSSCIDVLVELLDCPVKGCPLRLHHVCQERYAAMNEINIDGGERKNFRDCADKIRVQYKSKIL